MSETLHGKRPRVLWADDEALKDMYESSRELLKAYFDLQVSETIDKARELIKSHSPPEVIILDIIFGDNPDEGIQLLDDIANAKDGVMSNLKVVVLTADSYLPDITKIKTIINNNSYRMRFYQKMVRATTLARDITNWLKSDGEQNT